MNKELLATNLKRYRMFNGLTQKDVAAKLGVSRATIINWENKPERMPFTKLMLLADLYNIKADDFFVPCNSTVSRI